jgi:hypothetical protein
MNSRNSGATVRQGCYFAILSLCLFAPTATRAESHSAGDEYKAEVGAFYTGIHLKGFGETINGLGARFGYNINKYLAVDAEASFMPETHLGNNQLGQKVQGFIGVKAGMRSRYVGVFAKARPGVMFIGEVTSGFNCSGTGIATICRPSHNNFALDAGGVIELYPSSRTIIRFDAGDTIVRIRSATAGILLSTPMTTIDTTHNFQLSLGFGYRF